LGIQTNRKRQNNGQDVKSILHSHTFAARKILMFRLLLLTFLTIFSTSLNSQNELRWSAFQTMPDDNGPIIGGNSENYFSIVTENYVNYLTAYSAEDFSVLWHRELTLGPKARVGAKGKTFDFEAMRKRKDNTKYRDYSLERFYILKDSLYVFYKIKDTKTRDKKLYAQIFDLESTALTAAIEINKESDKLDLEVLTLSNDSTKLFQLRKPKQDKSESHIYQLKIWDREINEKVSVEIELPYKGREFSVYDISLSESNNLHMLARINIPRSERGPDDPSFYYTIVTINPASGESNTFDVKLSNLFVRDVSLRFDQQGNAFCVGIYSDKRNLSNITGTFYFKIDVNTGAVSAESVQDFQAEIIKMLNNSNSERRRNSEIRANIEVKEIVTRPDGGSYILFEEEYVQVVTTSNPNGGTTTTRYYHNNDILFMNIDESGKILWQTVFPKQQVSTNDGGRLNSFAARMYKDKLYILFNDDKENADTPDFKNNIYPQTTKNTMPVVMVVNNDGVSEKIPLLAKSELTRDYDIKFNNSKDLGTNRSSLIAFRASKGCCSMLKKGASDYKVGVVVLE
jgi:hypothetical protein